MAVGIEDPLALGQSRSSSSQKLKLSAGSLLNKWGEGAHFFFYLLSPFTLSFGLFFVRRDHRNAKRSRNAVCLITLLAEEWLLWMDTVVTWPCCRISPKRKHLHIHQRIRVDYAVFERTDKLAVLLSVRILLSHFNCCIISCKFWTCFFLATKKKLKWCSFCWKLTERFLKFCGKKKNMIICFLCHNYSWYSL